MPADARASYKTQLGTTLLPSTPHRPPPEMTAAKIKSKLVTPHGHPTVTIPRNKHSPPSSSAGSSPTIAKTPKTPADEGIDFFESSIKYGEAPVSVYELPLEPDGGPSKSREVGRAEYMLCHTDNLCTVHTSSPRSCSVYSPRLLGSGYSSVSERCVQNQFPPRRWCV